MTHNPDDVVRVFAGTLVEVETYQQVLTAAGIESKVVGTELTAGLGTALQGSIELWVHRADAEKAAAAIKFADEQRGKHPPAQHHPHPTSDPRPGTPPRHREPHVKQDPLGE
jgi:hypothetical protein